jgi:hypothetical protein
MKTVATITEPIDDFVLPKRRKVYKPRTYDRAQIVKQHAAMQRLYMKKPLAEAVERALASIK